MAQGDYYVDPSIDADTGSGTLGSPYGDLQHALDTITQGSSGDTINIKAGTAEVLSAALDLTSYGTPNYNTPLLLKGYTTAKDDGGKGEIDCNGTGLFAVTTHDHTNLWDLKIHNSGANHLIQTDDTCWVRSCELYDTAAGGYDCFHGDAYSSMVDCECHDFSGYGFWASSYSSCLGSYFWHEVQDWVAAIGIPQWGLVEHNIIVMDGDPDGMVDVAANSNRVLYNSILQLDTGVGTGCAPGSGNHGIHIGNLFEGLATGLYLPIIYNTTGTSNNAAYNCTTGFNLDTVPGDRAVFDNEVLSESPFLKQGANTFANRFVYFRPKNIGNVWNGGGPTGRNTDKGAVQRTHEHVSVG